MASIAPTVIDDQVRQHCAQITWVLPTSGDFGLPVECSFFSDKCVHVFGTLITACSLQGSNDPRALVGDGSTADWQVLDNPQGTGLTFSANGLKQVLENPRFIRPILTTGTAATVILQARRGN